MQQSKTRRRKPPAKKPPTLDEVKAIVLAWLAANHPNAEHVTLSEWDWKGCGNELEDVLGPPTDKQWFTNDLPETPEQAAERESRLLKSFRQHERREMEKDKVIRKAAELDPQSRCTEWLARWSHAVALLAALDQEFEGLQRDANDSEVNVIRPDHERLKQLACSISNASSDSLVPPFRGFLDMCQRWNNRAV